MIHLTGPATVENLYSAGTMIRETFSRIYCFTIKRSPIRDTIIYGLKNSSIIRLEYLHECIVVLLVHILMHFILHKI